MRTSFWTNIRQSLRSVDRWLNETPERALDQAYDAALKIKALEDAHFDGKPVSASGKYSSTAFSLIKADLKKYLQFLEVRLSEFKTSRFVVDSTNSAKKSLNLQPGVNGDRNQEYNSIILEKLRLIDEVLNRYKPQQPNALSLVPLNQFESASALASLSENPTKQAFPSSNMTSSDGTGVMDKTGVLPRSIVGTLSRIKRDLDPSSEQQVVQSFRSTKTKTLISIRFLLLLIIIPLLTQQLSEAFVIGPIVDHFRNPEKADIFLNLELQEEALQELKIFEERLHFDSLLGRTPSISEAEVDERLKEKVGEIAEVYSKESSNAVKNVFADLLAFFAFGLVIVTNRPEIAVLKSFIDETVYGLSDSAKAFIIILFTDMFVGFHSPHGWEVLLEGISRHFGLPSNRDFNFLFIATFPVILDTIFKYWIFRYLNRISPSAVATYRNMNE